MSNSIVADMKRAIFYNESIEELTPLDLTGTSWENRMEIYYLYSKYGKDPERRTLCEKKLEDLRDAAGRHSI